MQITKEMVAKLYLATFGRPLDSEGLQYWTNTGAFAPDQGTTITTMEALSANFSTQTEYTAKYPASTAANDFVTSVYNNLLGRAPDADGLAYWTDRLDGTNTSGTNPDLVTDSRDSFILTFINGATDSANGNDLSLINNRAEVALHLAEAGNLTAAIAQDDSVIAAVNSATDDHATVATAESSADAAVNALANPAVALTVDPDTLTDQLTTGDDTIDASTVLDSLNSGDIIIDNSTTDNDTLNAKITAQTTAIAPTIINIENINLDLQGMRDVTYDATSTTNANITLLSTQFGFGGNGIVTGLKNGTTVTAGDKIENLDITTSAATDTATVVLSGDVTDLAIHTATSASISTTADATVNYTPDAITTTTITGDKSVTLKVAGGDVTAKTVTSELTAGEAKIHLTDATNVDATKFTVDSIVLGADGAQTISIVDGATVEVGVAQTNTVTINNGTAAGAYTANIKTGVNISVLDVSDADLSTNLELTANSEIATLTSTANNVTVTGTGNLNISTTIKADKLDASALNGKLDIADNSSNIAVLGGTGAATIAFAADYDASFVGLDGGSTITSAIASDLTSTPTVMHTLSVQTGSGVDTLEQTASIEGLILNAQLGAGDDVIKLTDTAATAADADTKIAIDMGAGNDTLELVDELDLSAAGKLELVGLETIQLRDAGTDGASATFAASQLDGLASTIKGTSVAYDDAGTSDDTTDDTGDILNVNLSATDTSVDLSTLTLDAVDIVKIDSSALTADLTIKGTATRDVITGGNGNDTIIAGEGQDNITGGKGADTLTGGAGADTFVFASGDSSEASMAKITDFSLADFDVFDNDTGTKADDANDKDVKDADADKTATDIKASITNGILTLSGDDASAIDTLAEWIDVAEIMADNNTLAFEFDGNTYVAEASAADIVELTGLTGIVALGDAAGVDTLVIA